MQRETMSEQVTTYTYDQGGRLSEVDDGVQAVTYEVDEMGNRLRTSIEASAQGTTPAGA